MQCFYYISITVYTLMFLYVSFEQYDVTVYALF